MSAEPVPIALLGGGLTGLAASLFLGRAGVQHRLFEREAVAGGHAVTLEEQGFRFDRTGHLLHLRDPEMRALATELLPPEQYRKLERRSAVFSHGVYTRYPFQANTFGLPPEVAYECLSGFLAAYFAESRPEPQSFAEWCQRFVPLPKLEDVLRGALGATAPELGYNASFWYPERGMGSFSTALAAHTQVELAKAPERIDLARRVL